MAQHLSIRIPWHDNGYNGTVCKNPCANTACLRLKNIHENRDIEIEKRLIGKKMAGNEKDLPCIAEGAAFLTAHNLCKTVTHPYKKPNSLHEHFLPTEVTYPAYSLPARPFRWLMKKGSGYDYELYGIDFDKAREPALDFDPVWVQDAENQKAIFDYFYHMVEPQKSLCILYAKQVPFVEDTRRVIMGIGFIEKIYPAIEHKRENGGKLRSMIWETMIGHTIREDRKNGFILPYYELMQFADTHPEFDITEAVVFEPEGYREEFSYATEHLSYDAVIEVLLQTKKALNYIKMHKLPGGNWTECINWINERIEEVWNDRGAFPGLGAMLKAVGFKSALLLAEKVKQELKDGEDIGIKLDTLITKDKKLVDKTEFQIWKKAVIGQRKTLFQLLSRITLSFEQADIFFNTEKRHKSGIQLTDAEIIENPYRLYEQTRECADDVYISIRKIDMAVFPPEILQKKWPLPEPSKLTSGKDQRRVRALILDVLENKSLAGHTIYPEENIVEQINELPIEPDCHITCDNLTAMSEFFLKEISVVKMKSEVNAYKLKRYSEIDELIKKIVDARIKAPLPKIEEDWRGILDKEFDKISAKITGIKNKKERDLEEKARTEKAACMQVLAESKLSVLVGGAGTGKTALLSLLCTSRHIQNGGILVLAPTGKARVKLSTELTKQKVQHTPMTLAQFAYHNGHFKGETVRYVINGEAAKDVPQTVIIDECSMLAEEMMGALLEMIKPAKRIILVGDPNQLPPIGAGRPFVDLVHYLRKSLSEDVFPCVCKNFGQLTVDRRQRNGVRDDAELARWFISGGGSEDDDIFSRLQANELKYVKFKHWETEEDLQNCLFEVFKQELAIQDKEDTIGFNRSLGGQPKGQNGNIHFNTGDAKGVDNWQILSPVRNLPPAGVSIINDLIHRTFREAAVKMAQKKYGNKIYHPLGPENIVYSDKVINVHNMKRNKKRPPYPPHKNENDNYIANGEIGIVVNGFVNPSYFNVEFSSQQGRTYSFSEGDFGEEREAQLELAYALTIHKAQGSEFKIVILILAEPCPLLSRELLYTALTRQSDKLIILYNQEAYKLRTYASDLCSDISKRFTALFEIPDIVKINEGSRNYFFEEGLIHRTLKGHLVRSKSELVIANRLYEKGIDYEYEKEIVLDGVRRSPDFTITTLAGDTFYWEHCGMLGDPDYEARWEKKKEFYTVHGIIEEKNLIVTSDDKSNGALDTQKIEAMIEKYLV
ncbi:MAG: ATP-dependent RecD-like DNA helicase [Termitinemataceae bacterium]|nr:MAG: ATP-dependent RecD-like DNA helicase [Termitinemataceae bacterium]